MHNNDQKLSSRKNETINHRLSHWRVAGQWIVGTAAVCLIGILLWAQSSKQPQTTPAQQNGQSATKTLSPVQLDGEAALRHLNRVISWYRRATTGTQSVGQPSDAIYQDNSQSLGAQAVRLAFQSAKAEAELLAAQQKTNGANHASGQTTQQQNLEQMLAKTSSQIDQLQSQIENLNAQIAKTPAARRNQLVSRRDALQGELELQKALLDAVQKMAAFVETNGERPRADWKAALINWRDRFLKFWVRRQDNKKSSKHPPLPSQACPTPAA